VLGKNEAVKLLAEVLNHIIAFGLSVHQQVKADFLLEANDIFNFFFDKVLVLFLSDFLLSKLGTLNSDFFGLLRQTS
jgi:hypothetical protein